MKRITFVLSLLALSAALWAVPAKRTRLKVQLTDGTEVYVNTCGDEYFSWLLTDDQEVIEPAPGRPGLYVRSQRTLRQVVETTTSRRYVARRLGSRETAPLPTVGSPKVPVVLVSFQDSVFHVGQTDEEVRTYYDLYCNGTRDGKRYTGHGSYGSIRDYFLGQSDSLFYPEFVVIGPVQLDNPVATYGKNSGSSHDSGYDRFVKEALAKATAQYDGNWSDFDNKQKGNGNIDLIFFIFAGCGENTAQLQTDLMWPKESVNTKDVTLDDGTTLHFASSACTSENSANKIENGKVVSVSPDGIGVMCHELSHALGLPDFYDCNYTYFGMDVWSLMDYGCYVQNSKAPAGYTAYERDFMGWRQLQELKEPGYYTLNPIASQDGVGMKITNPQNSNEYYVVEARLASNWDKNLARYGHGLQVTHVNYVASAWSNNTVNTGTAKQRMTIIAANNRYVGTSISANVAELRETWAGNLYPYVYTDEQGEHRNDSLTAHSTPAATVYSSSGIMPHTLTQISLSEDEQQATFLFDGHLYDAVRELRDDDATTDNHWFDLTGRRVGVPCKPGVYVVGNKKIILTK